MTQSRITLECFDDGLSGPSLVSGADYQKGFDAGVAQAEAAITAQQAQAIADINATLGDMAFSYTEARGELLGRIRPILTQVAEAVLPMLAQETFSAHLVETLEGTFKDATDQAVKVAVAPDMVSLLGEAEPTFKPVPDPSLAPGQARLRRGDTHIMIDLPALVTALQAALQGLEATQRTQAHG